MLRIFLSFADFQQVNIKIAYNDIVSENSLPNFVITGANSLMKVDITWSLLLHFGGLYMLPSVICYHRIYEESLPCVTLFM